MHDSLILEEWKALRCHLWCIDTSITSGQLSIKVFQTCLRVESRKILTSLTNLRKIISVVRSAFPVNGSDHCFWLPSRENYKSVTLPFQLSKNIGDVIPQATTLCLCSPKFKLSLKTSQGVAGPQNTHWVSEHLFLFWPEVLYQPLPVTRFYSFLDILA